MPVRAVFERYNPLSAVIQVDKMTQRPRGFGFVIFKDRESLQDAVREMHNKEVDGRTISVKEAIPQDQIRPGTRLGSGGRERSDSRGGYGGRDRYDSRGGYGDRAGGGYGGGYDRGYDRGAYGDRGGYAGGYDPRGAAYPAYDRGYDRGYGSGGYGG